MGRTLTIALIAAALLFWAAGLSTMAPFLFGARFLAACAPAALGALMLLALGLTHRIFSQNDAVRRRFTGVLAATLLVAVATVYADVYLFHGEVLLKGLSLLRLEIFTDFRFPLLASFAAACLHPALFVICGFALLMLPPPEADYSRQFRR